MSRHIRNREQNIAHKRGEDEQKPRGLEKALHVKDSIQNQSEKSELKFRKEMSLANLWSSLKRLFRG